MHDDEDNGGNGNDDKGVSVPVRSEDSDRSKAGRFCNDKTSPTGSDVEEVANHC